MLTDKRILDIKQKVFEDETVSDGTAVRYGVGEDTHKDLKPVVLKDLVTYRRSLNVSDIADAVEVDDRKEILRLTDWNQIGYDESRAINRSGLTTSAIESWEHRDYLDNSDFMFNQNNKKLDKFIIALIAARLLSFNKQERKRTSLIFRVGRSMAWSPQKIASELKNTAGLNAVQLKALYNIQSGMAAEGFGKAAIIKKSNAYMNKALIYRAALTSRWESASVINEGQLQLWGQLDDEGLIPETAMKVWETILDNVTGTPDRAMNGQKVLLGANFEDPTLTHDPLPRPPLRGNCRCGIRLINV